MLGFNHADRFCMSQTFITINYARPIAAYDLLRLPICKALLKYSLLFVLGGK